jgi:ribose 5-phosphate isomerase B
VVWNDDIARLSRQHNDANILILPARFVSAADAVSILRTWLATEFEGGRHAARVAKIDEVPA